MLIVNVNIKLIRRGSYFEIIILKLLLIVVDYLFFCCMILEFVIMGFLRGENLMFKSRE